MLPYITFLGRKIPLYSLMALVGIGLAYLYLQLAKKRFAELENDFELAFLYGLVGMLIGAKVLSIVCVLPEFIADLKYLTTKTALFIQKYFLGGFVFYGGLFGAVIGAVLYAKAANVSVDMLLMMMLPVVPLIHAFGRIGCFCMGCCYGVESHICGIAFRVSEIAPNHVPLFPVQLFEAGFEFLMFAVLVRCMRKGVAGGRMLGIYFVGYGLFRFVNEFFRGDMYRGFIGALSVSQIISILTVLIGAALLFLKGREQRPD